MTGLPEIDIGGLENVTHVEFHHPKSEAVFWIDSTIESPPTVRPAG
jgi:hypothetical protein